MRTFLKGVKQRLRREYSIDAGNVKEASFYPLGEDFRGEGPKAARL